MEERSDKNESTKGRGRVLRGSSVKTSKRSEWTECLGGDEGMQSGEAGGRDADCKHAHTETATFKNKSFPYH